MGQEYSRPMGAGGRKLTRTKRMGLSCPNSTTWPRSARPARPSPAPTCRDQRAATHKAPPSQRASRAPRAPPMLVPLRAVRARCSGCVRAMQGAGKAFETEGAGGGLRGLGAKKHWSVLRLLTSALITWTDQTMRFAYGRI